MLWKTNGILNLHPSNSGVATCTIDNFDGTSSTVNHWYFMNDTINYIDFIDNTKAGFDGDSYSLDSVEDSTYLSDMGIRLPRKKIKLYVENSAQENFSKVITTECDGSFKEEFKIDNSSFGGDIYEETFCAQKQVCGETSCKKSIFYNPNKGITTIDSKNIYISYKIKLNKNTDTNTTEVNQINGSIYANIGLFEGSSGTLNRLEKSEIEVCILGGSIVDEKCNQYTTNSLGEAFAIFEKLNNTTGIDQDIKIFTKIKTDENEYKRITNGINIDGAEADTMGNDDLSIAVVTHSGK